MMLSADAEEVATFFAKMLDHEYTTKDVFRKNFFKDWRKVHSAADSTVPSAWEYFLSYVLTVAQQEMTSEEKAKITDLKKCNFSEMHQYFKAQTEARKAMTKEEKLVSLNRQSQLLSDLAGKVNLIDFFCFLENKRRE